ncbi:excisionase [Escherichia coli]|nr:excisionase [Escherichia coli]MCF7445223.1 hypothetical protein [Escherichia coli]MCH6349212.1 hypothetical protein [Escherichia coli]MDY4177811.1 excisionase [Escherichia coli]MDY7465219.1 excisionase [Escherichia coli]WAX91643.1 hypothetical protein LZG51_007435 [Escherichia coli]
MYALLSGFFHPRPDIAVKVDLNRPVTSSLLKRIRNGKKAKS